MISSAGFKIAVDKRLQRRGMTQGQLAEGVGMSRALLLGRMKKVQATGSLELIQLIAAELGIETATLIIAAERESWGGGR